MPSSTPPLDLTEVIRVVSEYVAPILGGGALAIWRARSSVRKENTDAQATLISSLQQWSTLLQSQLAEVRTELDNAKADVTAAHAEMHVLRQHLTDWLVEFLSRNPETHLSTADYDLLDSVGIVVLRMQHQAAAHLDQAGKTAQKAQETVDRLPSEVDP